MYQLCAYGVAVIGLLCLLAIFGSNLIFSGYMDIYEYVIFENAGLLWVVVLLVFVTISFALVKYSERISEYSLFFLFSLGYLVVGCWLIFSISDNLRADSQAVYQASQEFLRQNYEAFEPGGYLNMYPHQIGLMLYDALICAYYASPKMLFFANLLEIIGINWCIFQIARLIFSDNKTINLLTVVWSFSFLPLFLHLAFAYNTIPGLLLFCMGWYFLLRWDDRPKQYGFFLLGAICLALSAVIRNNFLIGVIAICLWQLICWFKTGAIRCPAAVLGICLCFVAFNVGMKNAVYKVVKAENLQPIPSVMYVAMGTDPTEGVNVPGWYNDYIMIAYDACGMNSEESSKEALRKIEENLDYHIHHPKEALDFFVKKFVSTWCEPTYASVWSGPAQWANQPTTHWITQSLYQQGYAYQIVRIYCKGILMGIFAFAMLYCIQNLQKFWVYGMPILYLIGGVMFHLMWETKSQYVYPYVFLLLPLCAAGVKQVCDWLLSKRNKTSTYDTEQEHPKR